MTFDGPVTTEYLRAWGRHTHGSPLYQRLVTVTAANPELMAVIRRITNRPPPNVYFAAIHFLLMDDPTAELAEFYPSITKQPRQPSEVDDVFTGFVLANQERIVGIANERLTQTNECRRCTALMPAILTAPFDSFHLVDLGTSAGLNLAFDRYRYLVGDVTWGPTSPVVLKAEVKGDPPRVRPVSIGRRVGIDLNIVDPAQSDDRRWLDALIWPEHAERRQRLRNALELAATVDKDLIEASFLEVLEDVLTGLPGPEPAVVMNSFSLIQLDEAQREQVAGVIEAARSRRPIHRVSLELIDKSDDWARLEVGSGAGMVQLGTAHPHGEWVDLRYQVLP